MTNETQGQVDSEQIRSISSEVTFGPQRRHSVVITVHPDRSFSIDVANGNNLTGKWFQRRDNQLVEVQPVASAKQQVGLVFSSEENQNYAITIDGYGTPYALSKFEFETKESGEKYIRAIERSIKNWEMTFGEDDEFWEHVSNTYDTSIVNGLKKALEILKSDKLGPFGGPTFDFVPNIDDLSNLRIFLDNQLNRIHLNTKSILEDGWKSLSSGVPVSDEFNNVLEAMKARHEGLCRVTDPTSSFEAEGVTKYNSKFIAANILENCEVKSTVDFGAFKTHRENFETFIQLAKSRGCVIPDHFRPLSQSAFTYTFAYQNTQAVANASMQYFVHDRNRIDPQHVLTHEQIHKILQLYTFNESASRKKLKVGWNTKLPYNPYDEAWTDAFAQLISANGNLDNAIKRNSEYSTSSGYYSGVASVLDILKELEGKGNDCVKLLINGLSSLDTENTNDPMQIIRSAYDKEHGTGSFDERMDPFKDSKLHSRRRELVDSPKIFTDEQRNSITAAVLQPLPASIDVDKIVKCIDFYFKYPTCILTRNSDGYWEEETIVHKSLTQNSQFMRIALSVLNEKYHNHITELKKLLPIK